MNRRLRGALLASVAGLAVATSAYGQDAEYIQPSLVDGAGFEAKSCKSEGSEDGSHERVVLSVWLGQVLA